MGLLGWPVAHSFSPAMHNAAARALALDIVYVPLPVAPSRLAAALQGLEALNFLGANVTVPHKQAIMPHLDQLEPAARAIGAVNTITFSQAEGSAGRRQMHGANTDHAGFMADLQAHDIVVAGRNCVVLGAGGSARAVAYALARHGARVTVCARRVEQAEELTAALAPHVEGATLQAAPWHTLRDVSSLRAPLIVNTTPVGMHPEVDQSPWPADLPFPDGAELYDLIYNPADTLLMQQARAAGCRAFNGLGMLLRQGALAFALWTGQQPPVAVMAAALPF